VGGSNLKVKKSLQRARLAAEKSAPRRIIFALAQSAETTRASSGKTAVFRLENALIASIRRTQKAGTH
jgi:hypothetical protein